MTSGLLKVAKEKFLCYNIYIRKEKEGDNMAIFYIADTHFGHENVIRFDKRPFANVEMMKEDMIERWNKKVGKNDTVYILGDFCWKNVNPLEMGAELNGRKILITGNHDRELPKETRGLGGFVRQDKLVEIKDNGRHVILCHYPLPFHRVAYNEDFWMLYGHVHGTIEEDHLRRLRKEIIDVAHDAPGRATGHFMNVGCMMPWMDYTPRALDEIIEAWEIRYGAARTKED